MADIGNKTFRETTMILNGQTTTEINFPDTTPNYIHINNYSAGNLYFGRSFYPTNNMYDMVVEGFNDNLFGSPNGFKKCYIYNDSVADIQFKVTSFEEQFDPTSLRNAGATSGGQTIDVSGGVDSTIVGFTVPLPSGNNNIGRVVVTDMPPATFTMDVLPAGTNNIGKVDVNLLPPLAEGVSHIGSVSVAGGVTISSMPAVEVTNNPVKQSHQKYWGTIAQTTITFDMGLESVNYISYIKNDGDTTLYIAFDDIDPAVAQSNGLNQAIGITPGEQIADFPRKCSKVKFWRQSGSGAVRFLGV